MNWRVLLDTNVVSRLARRSPPPGILSRLAEHEAACAVRTVTVEELAFGARVAPEARRAQLGEFVAMVIERFPLLPYDEEAAFWVAERRAGLLDARRTVEHADLCIAGVAGSRGMALVTNNRKDVEVLGGLVVEDWEAAEARPATGAAFGA